MNFPSTFLFLAALAAAALLGVARLRRRRLRRGLLAAVNVGIGNAGTHAGGNVTFLSSAAITQRYLLAKRGADDDHVVVASATTDLTRGVITDEAKGAEEYVNVAAHGGAAETRLVFCGTNVNQDDELVPHAATGGARPLTGLGAGTYFPFGRAARACSSGQVVEYFPVAPTARVV